MSTQDERFPRCRKAGLFPMPLHYKGAHIVAADAVEALLERLERHRRHRAARVGRVQARHAVR